MLPCMPASALSFMQTSEERGWRCAGVQEDQQPLTQPNNRPTCPLWPAKVFSSIRAPQDTGLWCCCHHSFCGFQGVSAAGALLQAEEADTRRAGGAADPAGPGAAADAAAATSGELGWGWSLPSALTHVLHRQQYDLVAVPGRWFHSRLGITACKARITEAAQVCQEHHSYRWPAPSVWGARASSQASKRAGRLTCTASHIATAGMYHLHQTSAYKHCCLLCLLVPCSV